MQEQGPIPDDKIPAAIREAVASPDRPDADKQLDPGRKPAQVLAFFGVAPGMKVADLFAGGGYTTELLARIVGPSGKVWSQEPVFPPERKEIEDAWANRLKRPALANVVAVHKAFSDPDFLPAPAGSLDVVVINLNYHDLVLQGVDVTKVNAAVFKALRSGGVYGVVDHSAPPGGSLIESLNLHRIDEGSLTRQVEQAGFKLGAASSVLRNPKDTRDWSTAPRAAGEKRGTSDRFVLRFVKP
ncbi:MAG TPA: SAM-dependent methyltransferase [Myxococcota bacterium]|nr:SAM-dependent methyltransferase [Myxococcota bacterium]